MTAARTSLSTPITATRVTRNRFGKTHGCSQLDFEAQHGEAPTGNVCREIGVAALEQADPVDAGNWDILRRRFTIGGRSRRLTAPNLVSLLKGEGGCERRSGTLTRDCRFSRTQAAWARQADTISGHQVPSQSRKASPCVGPADTAAGGTSTTGLASRAHRRSRRPDAVGGTKSGGVDSPAASPD